MRSLEEMDDIHIFSNHNLDITDINKLATKLVDVFSINIEYCVDKNSSTLQYILAENSSNDIISRLYNGEKKGTNFILEIGEAALFISNQILVYNLAGIESFERLLEKHNSENDHVLLDFYIKNIVDELSLLGSNGIIIAEDKNEIRSLKLSDFTFEQYAAFVKANTNYFTIHSNILAED